jgi:triphosphatase
MTQAVGIHRPVVPNSRVVAIGRRETSASERLSAVEAFQMIAVMSLDQYRWSEAAFLSTGDPEAVHRMRKALRQLLSAFWLFRPLLKQDARARAIQLQLRHLNAELGVIRNLDVCIENAAQNKRERSWLMERRSHSVGTACDRLHASSRKHLIAETTKWVESGDWRGGAVEDCPMPLFADARLSRLWRKIRKCGAPSKLTPEGRHRLRIRMKTLRDSLAFRELPVCPLTSESEWFSFEVDTLKDALGVLNDLKNRRKLRAVAGLSSRRDRRAEKKQLHRAKRSLQRLRRIGPNLFEAVSWPPLVLVEAIDG